VTLLSHQHPAVRYAMTRRRLIIGDEMGLGKTITSCAAAAADNAFPLIVACKPDLTENWRSEVSRILPGRSVIVAAGMNPTAPPDGTDVVIIGYAALGSRQTQGRSETFPWVDQLTALAPRALIIDEGHWAKKSPPPGPAPWPRLAATSPPATG
jgi:superfamily II DNA or RNA helicase